MNSIDFTQQNGFPLDQDVLGFLQNSIFLTAAAAALGGRNYILSGCEQDGNDIANGLVVIAGEIMPFIGGLIQEKVIVQEATETVVYEDGAVLPVIRTKVATFGDDGVSNLLWTGFKRNTAEGVLARLERIERITAPFMPVIDTQDNSVHRGGMVLWKKPAILIPAGWREVVDWRGRLPMGFNPDEVEFAEVGQTGGEKKHTLTLSQLPAHNHANGTYNQILKKDGTGTVDSPDNTSSEPHLVSSAPLASVGQNEPFPILNPYRVVIFIEYTGE